MESMKIVKATVQTLELICDDNACTMEELNKVLTDELIMAQISLQVRKNRIM